MTRNGAISGLATAAIGAVTLLAGVGAAVATPGTLQPVPVVRQALRNNCETAALSMLLAARGVRVEQLQLQAELRRNGPLDPTWRNGQKIWGDPSLGFVGRARGGGTSGGYGVYQWPLAALARRHGAPLRTLSGSVARIYRSLAAGRPVLAWVALSSGPYATWRSPQGRLIRANFGEHTVVLTALAGRYVRLNDPLDGRRKLWLRSDFERMWRAMGRRALGA